MRENRRLTVRNISEQVNTDRETVRKILTEDGRCVQKCSQRNSPKNKSKEEFLATKQITVLKHPAYPPDLVPIDFFSVPEDKGNIERKAF